MSKRKLATFFATTPKKKKPLPVSEGGITEYCIPISEPTSPRDILRQSVNTKRMRNRKKLFTLITTLLQNYPSDNCSCDLKLNFGGDITKKKFAKSDGVVKEIVVVPDRPTKPKSVATQAYLPAYIHLLAGAYPRWQPARFLNLERIQENRHSRLIEWLF